MKQLFAAALLLLATGCASSATNRSIESSARNPASENNTKPAQALHAVPLDDFYDVIKHWNDQNRDDANASLSSENITAIADNILLYQRSNGGWPTNKNPLRVLTAAEKNTVLANKHRKDSSLDNRNTYPQVRYLARVYQQVPDPRYKEAAMAGLRYILEAQLDNGGWTHSPPTMDGYRGHITIADDVMTGTLALLRDINRGEPEYAFLPPSLREQARRAQARGDALLLQLQVNINGRPAGWAGQYDRHTLQPATGRAFELPGVVSWETVTVVEYLLGFETPSAQVKRAIETAVAWLRQAQLNGIRVEKVYGETVDYEFHASNHDLVVRKDPTAPPLWARFYDLETGQPFFANRDGSKVKTLAEVAPERRTGYSWYGYWPAELLNRSYPAWRERTATSP